MEPRRIRSGACDGREHPGRSRRRSLLRDQNVPVDPSLDLRLTSNDVKASRSP